MASFPILQTKSVFDTTGGTSTTFTWNNNTTAGSLIFIAFATNSGVITSITDSVSNTYIQINTSLNGSRLYGYYAKNTNPGTTPTITLTYAAGNNIVAIAREYGGLNSTNPLDVSSIHTDTAVSPVTSGTTTKVTINPSELVIGYSVANSSIESYSAGTGFGNLTTVTDSSTNTMAIEDQTVTTIAAQAATFNTNGSNSYVTGVAVFVPVLRLKTVNLRPHIFSPGLAR